mmetsp:Transcript_61827/g.199367  ORF Transcript_61827/g.199367 Transcript_61827/m.199367 type:complete len:200 (+) Transcript_61827:217-816(+)
MAGPPSTTASAISPWRCRGNAPELSASGAAGLHCSATPWASGSPGAVMSGASAKPSVTTVGVTFSTREPPGPATLDASAWPPVGAQAGVALSALPSCGDGLRQLSCAPSSGDKSSLSRGCRLRQPLAEDHVLLSSRLLECPCRLARFSLEEAGSLEMKDVSIKDCLAVVSSACRRRLPLRHRLAHQRASCTCSINRAGT